MLGIIRSRFLAGAVLAIALGLGCAGLVAMPLQSGKAYAADDLQVAAAPMTLTTQADDKASASSKTSKPAKPSKKQLKKFKKASADFSMDLFKRCVAEKSDNANVTVSPMSVMSALAVTANGAGGKTAKQLRKVLGDGASMSRINKNLAWYNSKLVNAAKARLQSANSIWYHNNGSLLMKKAFLKKARKYYAAEVTPADFSDPNTVADVNKWVAKHTNNMIKKAIDSLHVDDRIAIINALYFDAEWREPFEKSSVQKDTFTNANGKKKRVQMMHNAEHTYIEGENVTGFIKPYVKGYSYVALLPAEGMSAKEYASTLTGDKFRKLIAGATDSNVVVHLPKYSLTYTNDSMDKQLKAMGIKKAFARTANFKKMAKDSMGNLYVGSVVHKTKIDLDEQGTKAAAVTAIVMKASSAFIGEVKHVKLNRPFVYAIVDNATKLPLFIGTVSDIGN